jgi:pre-mRNA cleavage complex 2 protein Pcf11
MSTALPSDEVAADFKDSLQDLQMNNRYEISNLTIIAKENTEHAMAISRVLETHIKTVRCWTV